MRSLTLNYVFSRNICYKRWRSEIERSVSKPKFKEMLRLEVYNFLQV